MVSAALPSGSLAVASRASARQRIPTFDDVTTCTLRPLSPTWHLTYEASFQCSSPYRDNATSENESMGLCLMLLGQARRRLLPHTREPNMFTYVSVSTWLKSHRPVEDVHRHQASYTLCSLIKSSFSSLRSPIPIYRCTTPWLYHSHLMVHPMDTLPISHCPKFGQQ